MKYLFLDEFKRFCNLLHFTCGDPEEEKCHIMAEGQRERQNSALNWQVIALSLHAVCLATHR